MRDTGSAETIALPPASGRSATRSPLMAITGMIVLLAILPRSSEAQEPAPIIRLQIGTHSGLVQVVRESGADARVGTLAQATTTDFTTPPSVRTSSLGKRDYQINFVLRCAEADGRLVDCTILINHTAVPLSGGHDHHDVNRPKGEFSNVSGSTGTTGFQTTYTAPEIGGVISLSIAIVFPPLPPSTSPRPFTFVQTIGVEVPGLVQLPAGNYITTGQVPGQHTDNHYGTEGMIASVLLLADDFKLRFPGHPLLRFNDMSLVQGGLLDAFGNNPGTTWLPPHRSHRFGNDIDVGLVSRSNRLALLDVLGDLLLYHVPEGSPETHYHFRRR